MQNVLEYHGQLNAELTSANNRVDILQKKINDLNGDRLSLEKETLTLGTNSLALERESDVLQSAVDDYPPESDALPSLLSVNVRLKKSFDLQTHLVKSKKRKFVGDCDRLRYNVTQLISASTSLSQKPSPPCKSPCDIRAVESKLSEARSCLSKNQDGLDSILQIAEDAKSRVAELQTKLKRRNQETKDLNAAHAVISSKISTLCVSLASRGRQLSPNPSIAPHNPYTNDEQKVTSSCPTLSDNQMYETPSSSATIHPQAFMPKPRASRSRQRILDSFPVIGGLEESDADDSDDELLFPTRKLFK